MAINYDAKKVCSAGLLSSAGIS